jgi:hypothetical protein
MQSWLPQQTPVPDGGGLLGQDQSPGGEAPSGVDESLLEASTETPESPEPPSAKTMSGTDAQSTRAVSATVTAPTTAAARNVVTGSG